MVLGRYEQETIVTYNEAEDEANVYTASSVMKRKLEKIGTVKACGSGWEITVPKGWVTIKPPRAKRQLSPEEAEKLKKRLAEGRKKCHNS